MRGGFARAQWANAVQCGKIGEKGGKWGPQNPKGEPGDGEYPRAGGGCGGLGVVRVASALLQACEALGLLPSSENAVKRPPKVGFKDLQNGENHPKRSALPLPSPWGAVLVPQSEV